MNILLNALEKPFQEIIKNTGNDYLEVLAKIKESNYELMYDAENNTYIDSKTSYIFDPYDVVRVALENSVSIACMLLSTNAIIVNNNKKTIDYN